MKLIISKTQMDRIVNQEINRSRRLSNPPSTSPSIESSDARFRSEQRHRVLVRFFLCAILIFVFVVLVLILDGSPDLVGLL